MIIIDDDTSSNDSDGGYSDGGYTGDADGDNNDGDENGIGDHIDSGDISVGNDSSCDHVNSDAYDHDEKPDGD